MAVETAHERRNSRLVQVAGMLAVLCAMIQMVFPAIVASGLPVGKLAPGGESAGVSSGLRMANLVASIFYLFLASVLAQVAGFRDFGYPRSLLLGVTWLLVVFLCLESILSWASPSPLEHYLWGPFLTIFAGSCIVLTQLSLPKLKDSSDAMQDEEDDPLLGN
jgi:hypothetical protein